MRVRVRVFDGAVVWCGAIVRVRGRVFDGAYGGHPRSALVVLSIRAAQCH